MLLFTWVSGQEVVGTRNTFVVHHLLSSQSSFKKRKAEIKEMVATNIYLGDLHLKQNKQTDIGSDKIPQIVVLAINNFGRDSRNKQ